MSREAAAKLTCTQFLRLDVTVNHPALRPEAWMYIYDEDKLSVRISTTEHFSKLNAPAQCSGIQVEVYGSEYRPCPSDHEWVKRTVVDELVEMGLVEGRSVPPHRQLQARATGESDFRSQSRFCHQGDPRFPGKLSRAAGRALRRAQISDDRRLHHLGAAGGQREFAARSRSRTRACT